MATVMQLMGSVPMDQQSNVLIDADIVVTFDRSLAPLTVNPATVRLYGMPGYSGVHYTVQVDPLNDKQFVVQPSGSLNPSTSYQLMIFGDYNVMDSILTGVQSKDGSVLDKNQIINFGTGTKSSLDIVVQPVIDVGSTTINEYGNIGPDIAFVNVMSTDPIDESRLMSQLNEITVRFDQNVSISADALSITSERLDHPLGVPVDVPVVGTPVVQNDYVSWPMSGDLFMNTLYTVKLKANKVTSKNDATMHLPEDYLFTFTSPFDPYLTTPHQVRMRGGFLVKGLSDTLIDRYILQESNDVLYTTAIPGISGEPSRDVQKLTTCLTVKEIARSITIGALFGVTSRQLADLTIAYDSYRVDRPLEELDLCIDQALRNLGVPRGATTGVKSQYATQRKYPNARRAVFIPSVGSLRYASEVFRRP
jgi:hypothetical protein